MHFIPADATGMPMQYIESAQLTAQKIAEVSEIPTVQKNAGALVSSSTEAIRRQEGGRACLFSAGKPIRVPRRMLASKGAL